MGAPPEKRGVYILTQFMVDCIIVLNSLPLLKPVSFVT